MSAMSGLQVAVDLALGKRDAAAQLLAQARQTWIAAQLQLDQLENYAQETTARWSKQLASCTPEFAAICCRRWPNCSMTSAWSRPACW